MNTAKEEHYRLVISTSNQKQLFQVVDSLSVHKPKQVFPSHSSKEELAKNFSGYFHNKVTTLRQDLEANQTSSSCSTVPAEEQCSSNFNNLRPMTESEVLEIIKETKMKSCSLDPLPACLLTDNLDLLLPHHFYC